MPPKARLHKEKGKMKSIPKIVPQTSFSEAQASSSEQDNQVQFEVELLWCIQQLQSALSSGKLNQKQIQDNTKTLNSLMSNSTPVIRKRQLMRLSFGDYRTKMIEEQAKILKRNERIVYTPYKSSKKSVFVKKAPFLTSVKDFKFNFTTPNDSLENAFGNMEIKEDNSNEKKINQLNNYHFEPSNNAFRFNFYVDME